MTAASQAADNRRASVRLLGAVFLLLLAGISLESLSPTLHLAGSIILALSLAIWWLTLRAPVNLPPLSVLLPAASLLLLEFLSLLGTPFPAPAYRSLVEAILIGAIALVVLNSVRAGWQPRHWQDALVLLGLSLTILELLLFAAWLRGWQDIPGVQSWLPPVGYRSSGLLLGHANVLAGLINLILPLLIVRAVQSWSRATGKLLGIPIAILLLGLFLTSSRAGWLSGIFGVTATLILVALATSENRIGPGLRRLAGRVKLWQAAVGAVLVVVVALAAYWQVSRTGHQPLAGARTPVWGASLQIIQQEPLLGHGLRSYPVRYAGLPYDHKEEDIPHAHNLILQVGAEIGAAGVIVLAALGWGLTRAGWKAWLRSDGRRRLELAAYGGAAAAFLSHAMFDFLLGPPIYAAAAAVLMGLFLGSEQRTPADIVTRSRAIRLVTALGPLTAAIFLLATLPGAWAYWDGVLAARDNRWQAASSHLCAAHDRNPADPVAASSCGLARQIAALQGAPDGAAAPALYSAASLDPAWGLHWANWGAAELAAGRPGQAASALKAGLAVYPVSPDLLLTSGLAAERTGDMDAAARLYRTALEINPWIWHSAYLRAEPHRLQGIEADQLEESLSPAERWSWRARLAIDRGDLEAAEHALQNASSMGGQSLRVAALRAEVSLIQGEPQAAQYHAQVAAFIAPNSSIAREIQAVVLADIGAAEAQEALIGAAESLAFQNRSRRYFFTAHGALGLPTDSSPNLLLGNLSARLARLANAALSADEGLKPYERFVLELLVAHCGCVPDTDLGANHQ